MNARRLVTLLAVLNDRRTEQGEHLHAAVRDGFAQPVVSDFGEEIVDNPLAPYPGLALTPANLGSERIV